MSDGYRQTLRGSDHHPPRAPDSEQTSAAAGDQPAGARSGITPSAEVIVGWRVWGVTTLPSLSERSSVTQPLILVSVYMNTFWQPGEVLTACCGADNVGHGIHAFTTAAEAINYMSGARKPVRYVFGEVSLWGRVVIHERGYRAKFAYPRRLLVPARYRGSRDYVNELRRSYGVEAEWTTGSGADNPG